MYLWLSDVVMRQAWTPRGPHSESEWWARWRSSAPSGPRGGRRLKTFLIVPGISFSVDDRPVPSSITYMYIFIKYIHIVIGVKIYMYIYIHTYTHVLIGIYIHISISIYRVDTASIHNKRGTTHGERLLRMKTKRKMIIVKGEQRAN